MPGERILIVEDDQSLRDVVAEALGEEGYSVQAAASGLAALEVAAGWHPDVVLLDLMMPRMDGEQFCIAMRTIDGLANVPIIVLSAARGAEQVATRIGASAALKKP